MKVLLRKDIEGVGRRGDIVEVAGGYARNFLLPSGSAMAASNAADSQAASMRRARDLKDAQDLKAAEAQKAAIERVPIRIQARASATGKLFGSVGPTEVAAALSASTGVDLDRGQVAMEEHIKELGEAQVTVTLFGGVEATAAIVIAPLD